jgi:acyl-CoA hydrolase
MREPYKLDPNVSSPATYAIEDVPDLLARVGAGGRVFIPGGPVEPLALASAFGDQPVHAADLTFCGMMIPGVNATDWAALHPTAQAEVFLPSRDLQATIKSGQTRVLPLHYSAAWRYLCHAPFKLAVFHVCPPDPEGLCNLSLSGDSSPAFFARDVFKLAIINEGLPHVLGAPSVPLSMFDAVTHCDAPPLTMPLAPLTSDGAAIAHHVASLVEDGATLQTGIGKLPACVMAALAGHKGLKLHSGLIGDWALDLMAAGAISDDSDAMTAGVILGSQRLQQSLQADPRLRLMPISHTHGIDHLAKLDRFTSINAALEIDLYGQINCEFAGERALAGVGGGVDFLRGARASQGGKPIIMIQAQGKDGNNRIVPRLATPSVSIARTDAPILVTQFGWVDLEPLDIQARARAIISLAAPDHHKALTEAWSEMQAR